MSCKNDNHGVRWFTETIYVDIDTGEILTKKEFKKNYTQLNKKQDVKTNRAKSIKRRIIEISGRRKPQIRITFGDE